MKLNVALKLKVLYPLLVKALADSYDGRRTNRAVVFVDNTKLFFCVKKLNGKFIITIVAMDTSVYFYKVFPVKEYVSNPGKGELLELFSDSLLKKKGLLKTILFHRLVSYWDFADSRDIIDIHRIYANINEMIIPR